MWTEYSHLFKNFPQFVVIHTVKGFGIVNKAEADVFLELSYFSMIQRMLAIWPLVVTAAMKLKDAYSLERKLWQT